MRKLAILIIILIVAMPLSLITTIIIHPLWRWFEDATGIESFGHSGPAEWCYLFDYAVFVGIAVFIVYRIGAGKNQNKVNAPPNKSL